MGLFVYETQATRAMLLYPTSNFGISRGQCSVSSPHAHKNESESVLRPYYYRYLLIVAVAVARSLSYRTPAAAHMEGYKCEYCTCLPLYACDYSVWSRVLCCFGPEQRHYSPPRILPSLPCVRSSRIWTTKLNQYTVLRPLAPNVDRPGRWSRPPTLPVRLAQMTQEVFSGG